jgi:hypothetical protein
MGSSHHSATALFFCLHYRARKYIIGAYMEHESPKPHDIEQSETLLERIQRMRAAESTDTQEASEHKRGLEDLKAGDVIQLPGPPYRIKIIEDGEIGDISNGKVTKRFVISLIDSMPKEEQQKVKILNSWG